MQNGDHLNMSNYDRQVAYINLIENGEKKKNAGYLKWESDGKKHKIDICVKGLYPTDTMMVDMKTKDGKLFDRIKLTQGNGIYRKETEGLFIGQDNIPIEELEQLIFQLAGNRYLEASWVNKTNLIKNTIKEPVKQKEIVQQERKDLKKDVQNTNEKRYETRWERLCDLFEVIHPFEDGKEFLKITPGDFYILRENYQHLGHNSFLLHGFYNYHYLIMGKKNSSSNDTYLLGVPGVYYEREIMAAKMFGFEGFDCSKPQCETGSFGYYFVTVE